MRNRAGVFVGTRYAADLVDAVAGQPFRPLFLIGTDDRFLVLECGQIADLAPTDRDYAFRATGIGKASAGRGTHHPHGVGHVSPQIFFGTFSALLINRLQPFRMVAEKWV